MAAPRDLASARDLAPRRPWRVDDDRILLFVRATPRAGRDAVDRIALRGDGRVELWIKLRAPPADGAANQALLRFVAKLARTPHREIALVSGAASRVKTLQLPLAAQGALEELAAGLPEPSPDASVAG
jgi:uncharacterized protein (TIGR00251 family)